MSPDSRDPGADASRPKSGILTPSSDGSVERPTGHKQDETPLHFKKRKFTDDDAEVVTNSSLDDLLKTAIVIKPHPQTLTVKPRILQPLMLLPRQHIALSHLDLVAPNGDLPYAGKGRLVVSRIRSLDPEFRTAVDSINVLIVRNESSRTVYAIEHYEGDLYVACKLGAWVELDVLRDRAIVFSKRLLPEYKDMVTATTHGKTATTPSMHRVHKKKKVAIEAFQSLVKQKARSQSVSAIGDIMGPPAVIADALVSCVDSSGQDVQRSTRQLPVELFPPPDASIVLESVRAQYFELLYKSRGSLAYFAKGSLSRARAAFHLDCEANDGIKNLMEFLRKLILTTDQINRKYQKTVPELISQTKAYIDSSDEAKSKKRRNRKMKLGQNALYPVEEELIATWWLANKPQTEHDENMSVSLPHIRSHVKPLCARETELQIILILEILALDAIPVPGKETEAQLPQLSEIPPTTEKISDHTPKNRSKTPKLADLLDLHVDRLCIWQSTASDQILIDNDLPKVLNLDPGGTANQTSSSEPLRDFCIDIILPFFSARLPDICKSINRKLGGPKIVSGEASKSARTSNPVKRASKPGTATKRPVEANPGKSTRTLERALSKEMQARRSVSRGPPTALELMRSATATASFGSVQVMRRDARELSLSSLGAKASDAFPPPTRGMGIFARSKSFNNLDEAKARKTHVIQAELQDAISGIRRPNREWAGKTIIEDAEKRATTGSKGTRKPERSSLGTSILVQATPVNNRFRNVLGQHQTQYTNFQASGNDALVPPSSASCIPDTVSRSGPRNAIPATPSLAETPTGRRKSFPVRSTLHPILDDALPSSPLMRRGGEMAGNGEFNVPGTVKQEERLPFTYIANRLIFETPTKPKSKTLLFDSTLDLEAKPPTRPFLNEMRTISIFEKLGWDDDPDELY